MYHYLSLCLCMFVSTFPFLSLSFCLYLSDFSCMGVFVSFYAPVCLSVPLCLSLSASPLAWVIACLYLSVFTRLVYLVYVAYVDLAISIIIICLYHCVSRCLSLSGHTPVLATSTYESMMQHNATQPPHHHCNSIQRSSTHRIPSKQNSSSNSNKCKPVAAIWFFLYAFHPCLI